MAKSLNFSLISMDALRGVWSDLYCLKTPFSAYRQEKTLLKDQSEGDCRRWGKRWWWLEPGWGQGCKEGVGRGMRNGCEIHFGNKRERFADRLNVGEGERWLLGLWILKWLAWFQNRGREQQIGGEGKGSIKRSILAEFYFSCLLEIQAEMSN